MLFLIAVPANNTRGPRYMEKSLAAMHQARLRHPVTLIYGSTDEQVGLFVRCHAADRDAVLQPILALKQVTPNGLNEKNHPKSLVKMAY